MTMHYLRALELIRSNAATHLDLRGKNLMDEEAAELAEALTKNTSLQKLNLSTNGIGDAGAAAVARALRENHTLLWLELEFNNINAAGTSALADALTVNTTLTLLNLKRNPVDDVLLHTIENLLENNKLLRRHQEDTNRALSERLHELEEAFAPENWIGKIPEMKDAWEKVPDELKSKFDFAAAFQAAQLTTLKTTARAAPPLRKKWTSPKS